LPKDTFLNVKVPAHPDRVPPQIEVTRLGRRVYRDALVRREDPWGRPYYWIGGSAPEGVVEPGTDIGALAEGAVSVTPIQMDMTAYSVLGDLRGGLEEFPGPWRTEGTP
jgi:5'-nucleotidase